MSTKLSNPPAYSIGKKPKSKMEKIDVGPGSYAASFVDRKKEPSFSMAGKAKNGLKLDTPGAGHYEMPSKIVESQGKTMAMKYKQKSEAGILGDGPGAYNPDLKKSQDFKFSMGLKLK
jgi:hypothetical protein